MPDNDPIHLVVELERRLTEAYYNSDFYEIQYLAKEFGEVEHPAIGYMLGKVFIEANEADMFQGYDTSAYRHLMHSASFGFNPDNKYLKSGFADSIGQSIWKLLSYFSHKKDLVPIIYKLYCIGYVALTNCIISKGAEAYDSLKTRAQFINVKIGELSNQMLKKYYYDGDDLCKEIVSMADCYFASIGYRNAGETENYNLTMNWATQTMEIIINLPQYELMRNLDMSQIAQISKENQDHLIQKLLNDFNAGVFKI